MCVGRRYDESLEMHTVIAPQHEAAARLATHPNSVKARQLLEYKMDTVWDVKETSSSILTTVGDWRPMYYWGNIRCLRPLGQSPY